MYHKFNQNRHLSLNIEAPKENLHPDLNKRYHSQENPKQEDQWVAGDENKYFGVENPVEEDNKNEIVPVMVNRKKHHAKDDQVQKEVEIKVPNRDVPPLPIENTVDNEEHKPTRISIKSSNRNLTPTSANSSSHADITVKSPTPIHTAELTSSKSTTNIEAKSPTESTISHEILPNKPKTSKHIASTPTLTKIPDRPAPDTPKLSSPSKTSLKSPTFNSQEMPRENSTSSTNFILKKSTSHDLSSSTSNDLETYIKHKKALSNESSFGTHDPKMLSIEKLSQSSKSAKLKLVPISNSNCKDSILSDPNLNGTEISDRRG
jgi:hypothetical protein